MSVTEGRAPSRALLPGEPGYAERREVAEATRDLTEKLARTVADPTEIARAAGLVTEAARILGEGMPEWKPEVVPEGVRDDFAMAWYFPFSPVIGVLNPLAPPIEFEYRDGIVCGTARFTAAYQGPPGCVHGGVIAEFFDELLGAANMAAGNGAMTGKLSVKYRSTTPLYTDLRFEARSLPPRGRKVHAEGFLWAGERLCAEVEGVFVVVDHETFVAITAGSHPTS